MKLLLIGSGGREHALAWCLAKSPQVETIYCVPGNGGTGSVAQNVDLDISDHLALIRFVKNNHIELTVVGPEAPLSAGIVDAFRAEGLKIFGPTRAGALVEASKCFSKEFCRRHRIPTANFRLFESPEAAKIYLSDKNIYPIVIKADGLAAGKGVIIADSEATAMTAVDSLMLEKKFGASGDRIVIEEFMPGVEATLMIATDGQGYQCLESAQDHKRIFQNDEGPNTGGMGAYSPAPVLTLEIKQQVETEIIQPFLKGMRAEGRNYEGILYIGLMIREGRAMVVEFNCRFGDPEAQAILMRLDSDLVGLITAVLEHRIAQFPIQFKSQTGICVVMSSKGYPGNYETGQVISGLNLSDSSKVKIFHAGTQLVDGQFITSGGRVLGVTALGDGLAQAMATVYQAVEKITWDGAYYRRDIGQKGLTGG